jgi:hypothetical protein
MLAEESHFGGFGENEVKIGFKKPFFPSTLMLQTYKLERVSLENLLRKEFLSRIDQIHY